MFDHPLGLKTEEIKAVLEAIRYGREHLLKVDMEIIKEEMRKSVMMPTLEEGNDYAQ